MSDIGIVFPWWFPFSLALVFVLPVTTAIMAGLGFAWYHVRRRGRTRRLTGLKWGVIIVAPFWLVGLLLGGGMLVSEIKRANYGAQHYFKLHDAAEIDGVALPAGTQVTLYEDGALEVAELPEGATLALRGATWQGNIEFAVPANAPDDKHGQITQGALVAPAVIQGIPCQAGRQVQFYWGGELMECTLSQDADASATIVKRNGNAQTERFRCLAGDTVQMAGLRRGEIEGCRLAEIADFGNVACAAGERILIGNGYLAGCTFARSACFGPLTLPAGSAATYYDAQPSNFTLPLQGDPVEGFGLSLPPGTEGSFCFHDDRLERLTVSRTAFVAIAGIKLTGSIDFDCGEFRSGMLFEDTVIGGRWRQRGELVSSADLFPQKDG